ncbi:hypothetical protein M407DRAFT_34375 [Tulasnella calospora MUT 4182]|uniref:non-specific serine/threonine protein kinase n=1 Tax=Tulasnella calospora MUT 4182 TaxID=1051891 RepID=A0A0C3PNJ3_9AGAM|nr:hypothetical protein M407DRAFT_34375 [Tulasnella calospora MUT 4182]
MSVHLNFTALNTCLQDLDHLFIDVSRLTPETGYEEEIGGYGTVRVSTLDSGTPGALLVAAKTIRLKDRHKDPKRLAFRLARELKIWAGFRHPHVLSLLGYYLDKGYKIAVLISLYMIHGDLKEYIDQQKPLWEARLHLVCDLTDGLAYLHEQTPPVLHGDIKMKNVLVNATRRGMLADFGLSKALEEGPTGLTTSDGLKGTLRCYSPELIRDQDSSQSLPSDIWAWGCLVLEALAETIPYAEKKSEHSIIRALMNGESPSDTEKLSFPVSDLKTLLARCWTIQPSERPSAVDCLRAIESALSTPRLAVETESTKGPDSLQQSPQPPEFGTGAADAPLQSQSGLPSLSLHLREPFWSAFKTHLDERRVVVGQPRVGGREVELHQLFFVVGALGGYRAVWEKQLWPVVGVKLGLLDLDGTKSSQSSPALTDQLSAVYHSTLADFETHWCESLRPTDPESVFPLPPQLQFLHPEIEEFTKATFHMSSGLDGPFPAEPENPGLNTLHSLANVATKIQVTSPKDPKHRGPDNNKSNHIVERALNVLKNRPIPTFGKHFPRKQTSEVQPLSNGEYDAEDIDDIICEAGELWSNSPEMRDLVNLKEWADEWDRRAGVMIAEVHQAGPNAPLERAAWEALFFEAYNYNYNLRRFEDVGRVVKRIRLFEELRTLQDTPLTMEDVEELKKQAVDCSLPPDNEQAVRLKEFSERGAQWCKNAQIVLEQPAIALEDLTKLVAPTFPVPVFPLLLERIGNLRGRACEIEKQAKLILYPSTNSRTPVTDALRLVSTAQKDFIIPAVQILAGVAPQAAHIEKTCFDILNNRYSPQASHKPLFEELRDMRDTVQKRLWMFTIPSFDIVDQQLVQHDAWLEKIQWHRAPEPAMQGKLIADDVAHNTRPENDEPPSDPECTCICLLPVKITSRRQADAVKCYDCGSKFHPECIEGSCPFCDHHHWNGTLPKPRNFEFTDLLHLATTAPSLTRNYSLVWKRVDATITSITRLIRSIAAFLSSMLATDTSPSPTIIRQIRHFLRKLYKIQFRIRARADLPPCGLTLCRLYRTLTSDKPTKESAQHRRPCFFFTAEFMPLASDGSRCICKGTHGSDHLITCRSCSYKFHGNCVIYKDFNKPHPEGWRCPMCMTRKGKQYPQSAVRVRAIAEQDINVFIDTKACLDNYSSQLIRQRLPPPVDCTIILELERFIPGSDQSTDSSIIAWLRPLVLQPYTVPSFPDLQDPSQTLNAATPSTTGSTSTSPPVSQAPSTGRSNLSLRMARSSSSYIMPNATKRNVQASLSLENLRGTRLIVSESGGATHYEISQEEDLFM